MINLIVLLFALNCPITEFVNLSDKDWNDFDKKTYQSVKAGCKRWYPKSPCVKKFIKVDNQVYRVICGGENK